MKRTIMSLACRVHAFLFGYMTRAGLILCDIDPKAIEAALAKIGDQVKEAGEKALAEAKKSGDMYAADKPKVDEMLVKQGELQAQLLDVQQKLARRSESEPELPKSPGAELAQSEEFKAYATERNFKKQFSMHVNAAITSVPTSAGPLLDPKQIPGFLELMQRRLTVRDLMTQGQTSQPSIQYRRETVYTNAAAPVSETEPKPESNITFDDQTARVIKLAHYIKASTEIMDDVPALQSFIDGRLRLGLAQVEETQLLKGSGVGNNLNGVYTQATAYAAPIVISGAPTKIDTLRLMLLQAELAYFTPDGLVMHPADWAAIELRKDTTGRYLIGNPQGTIQPTLWGRPVVATQAMTVDTALVGSFKMGATVFDRKQAAVTISTENDTDFVHNLVTILAEERLALIVWRPAAFIKNADLPAS